MSNYPKYEKYDKYKQTQKPSISERINNFFNDVMRVFKIANKPDRKEYFLTFKICAIGIVVLGAVSYVLQLIFSVVGEAINWN
jgi:protein translocase SEC61 complex gamma subunit